MLQWEWVAGETRPKRAQYQVDGRPTVLSGAEITLRLYPAEGGGCTQELAAETESGNEDVVVFTPGQEGKANYVPPGTYYARFKIIDQHGVVQLLPTRKHQFEITVYSEEEECAE